ncbi:MAG: hypothetical protein H3C27_01055 [Opitutaceae bacterium]|nr:hypothetical protein [Opitutaceae bacterium]
MPSAKKSPPRPANAAAAPVKVANTTFTDSAGQVHDLMTDRLYSMKEAAPLFGAGRSVRWLQREIERGNVRPILRASRKSVEIFACAVTDWRHRQIQRTAPAGWQ